MGASLESRKLHIINLLTELKDENLIRLIEAIVGRQFDLWEELSEAQRAKLIKLLERHDFVKSSPEFQNEVYRKKLLRVSVWSEEDEKMLNQDP